MDIDLKQWEKIRFQDIVSGDHILALRHSSIDIITPGTVEGVIGQAKDGDWIIAGWKVTPTSIHDLLVYKKRPEFILPNGVGAVITAENKGGKEFTFILADPNAHSDLTWYGSDEEWYSSDEIMADYYSAHTVKSEGVVL